MLIYQIILIKERYDEKPNVNCFNFKSFKEAKDYTLVDSDKNKLENVRMGGNTSNAFELEGYSNKTTFSYRLNIIDTNLIP